ncbi:hypothetical protein F0L74_21180 [Chitinophaga agrisoli]|uniref:Uncharacterized protein n=1 Tax=Chitinophaga agrisoli TaxID=2607653 RepID=A0A5B2VKB1_9BACT|nr:hypothetical protein [Chitinophaga agrisoli]KAA2238732.1 hypothetical protein F0L74_21180 [Chitinophaga agrisoli]
MLTYINKIKEILAVDNISIEKLMECVELVGANEDILTIKMDGARTEKKYTIFITFPVEKQKKMIRRDGDNLQSLLTDLLTEYIKQPVMKLVHPKSD